MSRKTAHRGLAAWQSLKQPQQFAARHQEPLIDPNRSGDVNSAPTLSCVANPTDNEGVTSVGNTGSGIVVTGGSTASPSVGLRDCDENQILVAGSGASNYTCADQSSVTAIPAVITFRTNTSVSAPGSGTKDIYASLSGDLSSTEATVRTPLPAGDYENITCRATSAVGSGTNTVKLFSGPCDSGSALASGNVTVTLPNSTDTAAGSGTTAVSSTNDCAVVKITVASTYAGEFINCSVEKTS